MANTNIVNGFKPVGTLSGGMGAPGWVQKCLKDEDDDTDLAVGDIVKLAASNESNSIPTITAAIAGDVPYGVVVSIENWDGSDSEVTQTLDKPRYIAASKRTYVLVNIAPDLVMEVQAATALEDGDIGAKAQLVDGGQDATAQTSGMEINTPAADSTYIFHILEMVQREDNALGADAKVLVTYNIHELGGGSYDTGESAASGQLGVHV